MKKKEYIIPQLSVVELHKQATLMAGSLMQGTNNYYYDDEDPDYEIEEGDFG